MPRTIKHYGWIPDLPDQRDFLYTAPVSVLQSLPSSVDLRLACPSVYNQGELGSCFPSGTSILLADGTERAIEEIGVGQPVLTHTGNVRSVTKVFERSYYGKIYTINVQGWHYPLTMTSEHPIAVIPNGHRRAKYGAFEAGELTWVKAEELEPGDFVLLPYGCKDGKEQAHIDIRNYIATDVWTDGDRCRVSDAPANQTALWHVPVNEQFAQLIGLFLAEGGYSKGINGHPNRLIWTFARHEEQYHNFVIKAISDLFNVRAYAIYTEKRPTVAKINCDNTTLAMFFHTFCGEHCYYKEVNPIFFTAPREIKLALLRGWLMGDGTQNPIRSIRPREDSKSYGGIQIEGATSSEALHRGMSRIAVSCHIKPGGYTKKQQEYQGAIPRTLNFYGSDVIKIFPEHAPIIEEQGILPNPLLTRYKATDLGFACRITSVTIEDAEDIPVYNLEVEDEHTYIANSIAVHNCTANAIAAAIQFDQMKQQRAYIFLPSRLFIYYNERSIEGTVASDSGAMIRDGIKSVGAQGVCPEDEWPYDITQFQQQPTDGCYQDALACKAILYRSLLQDLNQMKGCLASGYPFTFGFTVYQSFESDTVAKTGQVDMPQQNEQELGGHAVLAVGYNDAQQRFLVRNSWGDAWGMKGYFTIPYTYLLSPNLANDFWTIRLVEQ